MVIYVPVPVTSASSPRSANSIYLVGAQAFGPTRFAVLLFTAINSGKVLQLRRRLRANRLRTLLPIRRTHFSMFILFSNVNTHPPHEPRGERGERTYVEGARGRKSKWQYHHRFFGYAYFVAVLRLDKT